MDVTEFGYFPGSESRRESIEPGMILIVRRVYDLVVVSFGHMGTRDVFHVIADGGATPDSVTHYECRRCSRNLTADDEECPACGGPVAVYHID